MGRRKRSYEKEAERGNKKTVSSIKFANMFCPPSNGSGLCEIMCNLYWVVIDSLGTQVRTCSARSQPAIYFHPTSISVHPHCRLHLSSSNRSEKNLMLMPRTVKEACNEEHQRFDTHICDSIYALLHWPGSTGGRIRTIPSDDHWGRARPSYARHPHAPLLSHLQSSSRREESYCGERHICCPFCHLG